MTCNRWWMPCWPDHTLCTANHCPSCRCPAQYACSRCHGGRGQRGPTQLYHPLPFQSQQHLQLLDRHQLQETLLPLPQPPRRSQLQHQQPLDLLRCPSCHPANPKRTAEGWAVPRSRCWSAPPRGQLWQGCRSRGDEPLQLPLHHFPAAQLRSQHRIQVRLCQDDPLQDHLQLRLPQRPAQLPDWSLAAQLLPLEQDCSRHAIPVAPTSRPLRKPVPPVEPPE